MDAAFLVLLPVCRLCSSAVLLLQIPRDLVSALLFCLLVLRISMGIIVPAIFGSLFLFSAFPYQSFC